MASENCPPSLSGLRSQTRVTLSIQLKLNELQTAAYRASPKIIKSEEEVRDLHDRDQVL